VAELPEPVHLPGEPAAARRGLSPGEPVASGAKGWRLPLGAHRCPEGATGHLGPLKRHSYVIEIRSQRGNNVMPTFSAR
jgi:hypothetical protein